MHLDTSICWCNTTVIAMITSLVCRFISHHHHHLYQLYQSSTTGGARSMFLREAGPGAPQGMHFDLSPDGRSYEVSKGHVFSCIDRKEDARAAVNVVIDSSFEFLSFTTTSFETQALPVPSLAHMVPLGWRQLRLPAFCSPSADCRGVPVLRIQTCCTNTVARIAQCRARNTVNAPLIHNAWHHHHHCYWL